jgi:anti-anti-sigma regulatory factor
MLAVASGYDLDVERGPNWLLVRVRHLDPGDIDFPMLADRVWSLMQQIFCERLLLELDEVPLLHSRLIGQLNQLYRRIAEHDGTMRVCGLSPRNRAVLHQCRLDERLLPYEDRQEAMLGCMVPNRPR